MSQSSVSSSQSIASVSSGQSLTSVSSSQPLSSVSSSPDNLKAQTSPQASSMRAESKEANRRRLGEEEAAKDINEFALAVILSSHGWYQPQSYHFHHLKHWPPIPSPFANLGESPVDPQSWSPISDPLRDAWVTFSTDSQHPSTRFPTNTVEESPDAALLDSSRASRVIFGIMNEDESNVKYGLFEANKLCLDIPIERPKVATQLENGKTIRLRRLRHRDAQTGSRGRREEEKTEGIFIVNQDFNQVVVNNGPALPKGAVVGPLSSFSIIELDTAVVFWWEDSEAMGYVPENLQLGQRDLNDLEHHVHPKKGSLKRTRSEYDTDRGGERSHLALSRMLVHERPGKRTKTHNSQAVSLKFEAAALPSFDHLDSRRKRTRTQSESDAVNAVHNGDESGGVVDDHVSNHLSNNSTRSKKSQTVLQQAANANPRASNSAFLRPPLPGPPPSSPPPGRLPKPSASSRSLWQDLLAQRLAAYRESRAQKELITKSTQTGKFHQLASLTDIVQDDTLLLIATFWEGLRRQGRLFAYGGLDVFAQCDSSEPGFKLDGPNVVGAPHDLIIPLLMPGTAPVTRGKKRKVQEEKEVIGHYILAVAHWDPANKKANFIIWDSLRSNYQREKERQYVERARKLIQATCWPFGAFDRQVVFEEDEDQDLSRESPIQEGSNTCGFYMVLNAWCAMLGIPIHQSKQRSAKPKQAKGFLSDGLEIVNLALAGCLDAVTLQAFVNVWGYSEDQNPQHLVENVPAVEMDATLFARALNKQAYLEGRGHKPSEIEIQTLVSVTGLLGKEGEDEAREVLIEEAGNETSAVNRLLDARRP